MARTIIPKLGWTAVAILSIFASTPASAASRKALAAAPVPAEIVSARRIFISNDGRGCSPFGEPYFSGGPDRTYDQFYAAMKSWGRYKLAASPSAARLDFEIGFYCPAVTSTNSLAEVNAGTTYDPQFRLTILDLKTHTVLWTITVHVRRAIFQGNRDKNFDRGMAAFVSQLKSLVVGPAHTQTGPEAGM